MKVFVYGTLKQGYGNNRLLANAIFLGPAVSERDYNMIGAGFPVLMETNEGRPVRGELYEFDDAEILADLDSLEGEGRMYNRREINVTKANGDNDRCFVYIGHPDMWQRRWDGVQDARYINNSGELEWPGK